VYQCSHGNSEIADWLLVDVFFAYLVLGDTEHCLHCSLATDFVLSAADVSPFFVQFLDGWVIFAEYAKERQAQQPPQSSGTPPSGYQYSR
jgi:hypothetical protein